MMDTLKMQQETLDKWASDQKIKNYKKNKFNLEAKFEVTLRQLQLLVSDSAKASADMIMGESKSLIGNLMGGFNPFSKKKDDGE